jgi:hypothetical protein
MNEQELRQWFRDARDYIFHEMNAGVSDSHIFVNICHDIGGIANGDDAHFEPRLTEFGRNQRRKQKA